MSQRYLLKCSCGKEHTVEVAQAGDRLPCDCGKTLEVPSFRELKRLPVASDGQSKPRKKRSWHPLQGALFGIGALLFLVPLLWALGLQLQRSRLDLEEDPQIKTQLEQNLQNIAKLNIEETYRNWQLIKDMGLGERQPPQYIINRELHAYWGKVVLGMLAVSTFGLILIVLSLTIKPNPRARRRRRAA